MSAARQTGGRGRLGRAWDSPPGNLAASCLIRPRVGEGSPTELAFVMALAVFDAASRFVVAARLQLKWPNDVLLDGAKLSGILLERAGDAVIAGVGVNLQAAPALPGRATIALAAAMDASPPGPDVFLPVLAASFAESRKIWAESGFAAVRQHWLDRAHPLGTPLATTQGGHVISGTFAGLADDGALLLADADGQVHVIWAGDVTTGGGGG